MNMVRLIVAVVIVALALWIGRFVVRPRTEAVRETVAVPKVVMRPRPRGSRTSDVGSANTEAAADAQRLERLESARCPHGMALIAGQWCGGWKRQCIDRLDGSKYCSAYADNPRCRAAGNDVEFCIDKYEYPNVAGMLPAILVTAEQARSACAAEGKRLCKQQEWAFACEGPEGLAFPYGNEVTAGACNVGTLDEKVPFKAFWNSKKVSGLVGRLDRRTESGALPKCVSAFGVFDQVGNVPEWVQSVGSGAFSSALMGGDFTRPGAHCRTQVKLASPNYRAFPVGFRCCSDTLDPSGPAPSAEKLLVPGPSAPPVAPTRRFD